MTSADGGSREAPAWALVLAGAVCGWLARPAASAAAARAARAQRRWLLNPTPLLPLAARPWLLDAAAAEGERRGQRWGARAARRVKGGVAGAWRQLPTLVAAPDLWVLQKTDFSVAYDVARRTPLCCAYYLDGAGVRRAQRQHRTLAFFADPTLPASARWAPADVRRAGCDRGHLAPHASVAAGDQSALEAAMLSNVVLQNTALNKGLWKHLEAAARDYVRPTTNTATAAAGTTEASGKPRRPRRGRRRGGPPLAARLGRQETLRSLMAQHTPHAAHTAKGLWRDRLRGTPSQAGRGVLAVCVGPLFERPPRPGTVPLPDALFCAIWDCSTDHHVAFVVPNSPRGAASPSRRPQHAADPWAPALARAAVPLPELERRLALSRSVLAGLPAPSAQPPELFPRLQRRWRRRTWLPRAVQAVQERWAALTGTAAPVSPPAVPAPSTTLSSTEL